MVTDEREINEDDVGMKLKVMTVESKIVFPCMPSDKHRFKTREVTWSVVKRGLVVIDKDDKKNKIQDERNQRCRPELRFRTKIGK